MRLPEGPVEAASVTVRGTLRWPADAAAQLTTGFLVAEGPAGAVRIGTAAAPAAPGSAVNVIDNGRAHPELGRMAVGAEGAGARFDAYGAAKTPWALLAEPTFAGEAGSDTLRLDRSLDGWRVGDRLAIAPMLSPIANGSERPAETFEIRAIAGRTVTLDRGVATSKAGFPALRLQAEVLNLSRDVVLSGPAGQMQALHSRIGHGAVGTVAYTRVQHCGQHGVNGKYCLHFHMSKACPDCVFRGNAIEHGFQRGIIVHGTHRSVVEDNVLFDLKGSYLYVEDGNEMENLFKNNVALCPVKGQCKIDGTDNTNADNIHQVSPPPSPAATRPPTDAAQSGMWALSVSNDFIGNRFIGHEEAFFTQTSAFPHGRGAAQGRCAAVLQRCEGASCQAGRGALGEPGQVRGRSGSSPIDSQKYFPQAACARSMPLWGRSGATSATPTTGAAAPLPPAPPPPQGRGRALPGCPPSPLRAHGGGRVGRGRADTSNSDTDWLLVVVGGIFTNARHAASGSTW